MKALEKNEMKNVKGGKTICYSNNINMTTCVYYSDDYKTTCVGVYTFGGDTVALACQN